jgi:hypothetical protein
MARTRKSPWGLEALAGAVTTPAWTKQAELRYLVATADRMIHPTRSARCRSARRGFHGG